MSDHPDRPIDAPSERTPAMTAATVRAAQAARMRTYRARTGQTPRILVDLEALGTYLAGLTAAQVRAFAAVVGEDVTRRALADAERRATEIERPVAG